MKFILMVWSGELTQEQIESPQVKDAFRDYIAWTEEMSNAGVLVSSEGLAPSRLAKTVSVREGQKLVADGPFAETKEQVLGLFLIDVEDEAEALRWAEMSPPAKHGWVEVRAIHDAHAVIKL
jgi:hypothetical protein